MRFPDPVRPAAGLAVPLALALGLLLLLRATATLVMPIVTALLAVLLLSGAVERLQRRGLPAPLAAALAVFVPAGLMAGLAGAALPGLSRWLLDARAAFHRLAGALQPAADESGPAGAALRWLLAQRWSEPGAGGAWLQELGPTLLALAAVAMLSFFLLWAQRALLAGALAALPDRRARVRLLGALRAARRGAGSYLATMGWINLALAIATGLGLAGLGIANVPVWIAIVFVLLFIPYLGPAAAALLLLTATAPDRSAWAIAAPPLLFLGLHAVEAQFVSPWWMGRRLRVGRPALLLAVMAGAWAWGIAGGVLAVPLLIAAQALLARRRGGGLWRALLAGESDDAASLDESSRSVLENPFRGHSSRTRPRPEPSAPSTPCASPTSPKPTRPSSTASP